MTPVILAPEAYLRAVTLRDLADPAQGPHAMQQVVDRILAALRGRWGCTRAEANALRDAVYASLHEGSAWQWASAAA